MVGHHIGRTTIMQWLVTNWFWVLIGVAFFAMYLFGHGVHGGHGGTSRT